MSARVMKHLVYYLCLSVIALWCRLCCTNEAPDHAVSLHGPRQWPHHALPYQRPLLYGR